MLAIQEEHALVAHRYEAEQLPQTVTSHIDPRAFDAQRTDYVPVQDEGNLTAADCIPSHQWLTEFLADFAGLRSQLHRSVSGHDINLKDACMALSAQPVGIHCIQKAPRSGTCML